MNESFKTSIPQEQNDIDEQYKRLENTEGFKNLSEYQRRLVRLSLYIQKRAERLSSEASRQAVVSERQGYYMDGASSEVLPEEHLEILHNLEPDYYLDPKKRPYRTSQNHVSNWYCHPSVYALETENIPGVKPDNVPDSFFQAEYKYGEMVC